MKSRENLVRLKQFQVNEKRRQLMQLDMMIAEFDRMAGELEVQIAAEEKKSGITDINHFAYPTFAKAARAAPRQSEELAGRPRAAEERRRIHYSPKLKRSFPRRRCWNRATPRPREAKRRPQRHDRLTYGSRRQVTRSRGSALAAMTEIPPPR